jgi:hypothetical protein
MHKEKPRDLHLETAFLQLSFAIKLLHFLGEKPIDRGAIDIDLTIEDPGSRICLSGGEFPTYEALLCAAENNISIAFGAATITLWEVIRKHSGLKSRNLVPSADSRQNLAGLSYMLRCCFAHGAAVPVWSFRDPKYKIKYQVGNKTIDLSGVAEGQVFTYDSIGGYETLWFLRAEARASGLL